MRRQLVKVVYFTKKVLVLSAKQTYFASKRWLSEVYLNLDIVEGWGLMEEAAYLEEITVRNGI